MWKAAKMDAEKDAAKALITLKPLPFPFDFFNNLLPPIAGADRH